MLYKNEGRKFRRKKNSQNLYHSYNFFLQWLIDRELLFPVSKSKHDKDMVVLMLYRIAG